MRKLVGDPKVDLRVLAAMRKVGKPVSIDYIAHETGLSWHTARAVLFKLAAEGRIKVLETTKSWIFLVEGG